MNYQQKIPSTTKGLKWVHPGKLPLPKVWNLLVTISDQKYVCLVHFSMNCFFKWRTVLQCFQCVIVLARDVPQLCSINSKTCLERLTSILLLPHQHEALGISVEVDILVWKQPGTWQIHGTVLWEIMELFFQLLSISKSWPQKVKTLEWPVGPHYNWFDTFMWRSSNRGTSSKRLFHFLGVELSTTWGTSGEIAISRWGANWGQCWSALFLVPTKLVLIDW